jgi:hypothetical protein
MASLSYKRTVGLPVAPDDYNPLLDDDEELRALDEELRALDEELCALDDEQRAPTLRSVRSCSPAPPIVEYNEEGRIVAHSKGKGQAD